MKDAEVDDDQLKKAHDDRFDAVSGAKADVAAQADAGPKQYRAVEKVTLDTAAATATGAAAKGLVQIHGAKVGNAGKVKSKQQLAKEADEKKRADVVTTIRAMFEATKATVNAKLDALDT